MHFHSVNWQYTQKICHIIPVLPQIRLIFPQNCPKHALYPPRRQVTRHDALRYGSSGEGGKINSNPGKIYTPARIPRIRALMDAMKCMRLPTWRRVRGGTCKYPTKLAACCSSSLPCPCTGYGSRCPPTRGPLLYYCMICTLIK